MNQIDFRICKLNKYSPQCSNRENRQSSKHNEMPASDRSASNSRFRLYQYSTCSTMADQGIA